MIDGNKALEFATPAAVIIAAILQRWDASKAAAQSKIVKDKVEEVHGLTNSRMSALMEEVKNLKDKLSHNQISNIDDRLSRIEASSQAAANAATKAATIIGAK